MSTRKLWNNKYGTAINNKFVYPIYAGIKCLHNACELDANIFYIKLKHIGAKAHSVRLDGIYCSNRTIVFQPYTYCEQHDKLLTGTQYKKFNSFDDADTFYKSITNMCYHQLCTDPYEYTIVQKRYLDLNILAKHKRPEYYCSIHAEEKISSEKLYISRYTSYSLEKLIYVKLTPDEFMVHSILSS